jgi:hypothetical protein
VQTWIMLISAQVHRAAAAAGAAASPCRRITRTTRFSAACSRDRSPTRTQCSSKASGVPAHANVCLWPMPRHPHRRSRVEAGHMVQAHPGTRPTMLGKSARTSTPIQRPGQASAFVPRPCFSRGKKHMRPTAGGSFAHALIPHTCRPGKTIQPPLPEGRLLTSRMRTHAIRLNAEALLGPPWDHRTNDAMQAVREVKTLLLHVSTSSSI